jgi:hypothetical protein
MNNNLAKKRMQPVPACLRPTFLVCLTVGLAGVCGPAGAGTNAVAETRAANDITLRWRAEQGEATAQNNLGVCYLAGTGVKQDKAEALKWFHKSAEQGDAKAQFNLGVCYRKGEGLAVDMTQAALWFRRAAEQGLAAAQFNLGMCYLGGVGVREDLATAYQWFYLAGVFGMPEGGSASVELAKNLTPAQVAGARERAQQWQQAFAQAPPVRK